jgi:hypothetical protein
MKTLFPFIAVISILTSCSTSRITSYPNRGPQSYYYYPSANVYYDGGRSCYIYNSGGSWITASTLPSRFSIGNDRVKVFYNGPEVWRDNDRHRAAYYRQPAVVYEKRRARYRDRN